MCVLVRRKQVLHPVSSPFTLKLSADGPGTRFLGRLIDRKSTRKHTAFSFSLAVPTKSINLIKISTSWPGWTLGVIDISLHRALYRVRHAHSSELCGKNNNLFNQSIQSINLNEYATEIVWNLATFLIFSTV